MEAKNAREAKLSSSAPTQGSLFSPPHALLPFKDFFDKDSAYGAQYPDQVVIIQKRQQGYLRRRVLTGKLVEDTEMRTFWGRKGKPITLPCTLSTPEDTNFSLEWRKENKLILSAYGSEDGHAAPSSQGRKKELYGAAISRTYMILNALTTTDCDMLVNAYKTYVRPIVECEALRKAWEEIDEDVLRPAVDAFLKRLRACIRAKGGHLET
ncbi:unnamed protein product [Nippostrongylus brasiliensis]|uniref:DDE-1 domain-containing protein n=1 Tax=Nippostrongylus brasiliensis TaxID=27835 RepID=A0A0N4YAH7_NIPBR|nr:unnamed protein product [Nippostrongylus brasiliensis]